MNNENTNTSDCVIIFPHVPKCAGTTVTRHFQNMLLPIELWQVRVRRDFPFPMSLMGRRKNVRLFSRKFDDQPPTDLDNVKFVSAHVIGRSIEHRFKDKDTRIVTLMRDPVAQVVSQYNFYAARLVDRGITPPGFHVYLNLVEPNPVVNFWLRNWLELNQFEIARLSSEEKIEVIESAFEKFWFIGDISHCDELIGKVSNLFGVLSAFESQNTSKQWDNKTGWKSLRVEDLTDSQLRIVRSITAMDRYLWQKWALKETVDKEGIFDVPDTPSLLTRLSYRLKSRMIKSFGFSG